MRAFSFDTFPRLSLSENRHPNIFVCVCVCFSPNSSNRTTIHLSHSFYLGPKPLTSHFQNNPLIRNQLFNSSCAVQIRIQIHKKKKNQTQLNLGPIAGQKFLKAKTTNTLEGVEVLSYLSLFGRLCR